MDIHRVIAKNVRAFRQHRGISQEALAAKIGVDRTYISKVESGDRNTTTETIAKIAFGLDTIPHVLLVPNYLDTQIGKWEVDLISLEESIESNPSLRSFVFGYQAEYMAKREICKQLGVPFESMTKPDDHDRSRHYDISLPYKGRRYLIEVKCLQSNKIKKIAENQWKAEYQCDASDSREVELPNGHVVPTTSLPYGMFDIVAVGLFQFFGKWKFAFIKANDLESLATSRPTKKNKEISFEDKKLLIKSSQKISWPLVPPYTEKIRDLL